MICSTKGGGDLVTRRARYGSSTASTMRTPPWPRSCFASRPLLALFGVVIFVVSGGASSGAVYYVDGNCPNSGNGSTTVCGTAGGNGPIKDLQAGINRLSAPGDILRIRGNHLAHDGETSPFDGRYGGDWFTITNKNGASGNPIVLESYNYGTSSQETVYIEGTGPPTGVWTRCSDCTTGVCAGVPGTCSDVWSVTSSGLNSMVIGAQKSDGTPTYRVASTSALTSQYSSFSTYTSGGPILVRWGSALPSKPYVFYNNNGAGFGIGFGGKSSFITIRGFTFRCHRNASVIIFDTSPPSTDIVIQDNHILYALGKRSEGSDYGVASVGATNITIANNEIAYTGSEGIHVQAAVSGPTIYSIRNNWIHHTGDQSVSGPEVSGTPWGMILGDHGGGSGNGDYTGSVIEGNLIEWQFNDGTSAVGGSLVLENNSSNWVIRNNIFSSAARECLKLDAAGIATDNNQIYNNLFIDCGLNPGGAGGGGPGIYMLSGGSGKSTSNNVIYDNTFVNNRGAFGAAIGLDCSGACTGNVMRNNIMYDSGSRKQVRWPAGGTFQNNFVFAFANTTGTLVDFNGRSFSCTQLLPTADIDGDGVGNDKVRCVDPLFVSVANRDVHLGSLSPAIDAGTSTGMPAGRTASMNNTVAGAHGWPSYADNRPMSGSAWDVGALEFWTGAAVTASLTLSDPSPTAAGTVTVTLTTSAPVVQLPGVLTFTESDGSTTTIPLSGTVPGSTFTGTLVVNSSIAEGLGTFSLPVGSLVDGSGNLGNTIVSGAQTIIDMTPPSAPANLRLGI